MEEVEAECLETVLAVERLQRVQVQRQRQAAPPPVHVTRAMAAAIKKSVQRVSVGPLHGSALYTMGSNRFNQLGGASSKQGAAPSLLHIEDLGGDEPVHVAASWRK